MVAVADREVRRHILRLLADTPDGQENTRIVFQQLLLLAHRIVWSEFDRHVTYLERDGSITQRWLQPDMDRTRVLSITKRGLDIYEGTLVDPGIMPPAGSAAV
jgi:hypothetical protein